MTAATDISPPLLSLPKLISATLTVLTTALADCIWLVPFVAHAAQQERYDIAVVHAAIYVFTLSGLATALCVTEALVAHIISESPFFSNDLYMQIMGAVLCWTLACYLWIRSIRKQRQPQDREQQRLQEQLVGQENGDAHDTLEETETDLENSSLSPNFSSLDIDRDGDDVESETGERTFQPWLVMSMTGLGSLDEMMYFPTLLLAHTYTWLELSLGTLLASCIVSLVVLCFLRPCRPLMQLLEQIPLYGIVTCFACLLTLEVILEMV